MIEEVDAQWVDGRKILNLCFDHHLSNNPLLIALGEDVGKIGDVNQGFAGMQKKHGKAAATMYFGRPKAALLFFV